MDENKIVIYQKEDGQTQVDVRLENDTVWLTQQQMAELFLSSRTNIVEHIQHIYEDEELEENPTCRKFQQVRQESKRMVNREVPMYNLDMIISVGYRVNSKRGVKFRQWANRVLKDYLVKGYAVISAYTVSRLSNCVSWCRWLVAPSCHQEPLLQRWQQANCCYSILVVPQQQWHPLSLRWKQAFGR